MGIEFYFTISAVLLLFMSVSSLYSLSTKTSTFSSGFVTFLEFATLLSVTYFTYKFAIYRHICILNNIGLNLLNLTFLGLLLTFIFSTILKIKPVFTILSPIFLITYIVGFIKSLQIIPHKAPNHTILTYIHITLYTCGIVFNLLSLVFFLVERYLYTHLRKKKWQAVIFMAQSIEKVNKLGFVFLIVAMLVFGLGLVSGVYKTIETKQFAFLIDPISIGSILSFTLLFVTYISVTGNMRWVSNIMATFLSNLVIFLSYLINLFLNVGMHK